MEDPASSSALAAHRTEADTHTDDIDLTSFSEASVTQPYGSASKALAEAGVGEAVEANVILIAHPDGKRLGSRFRLRHGSTLEIGRDPEAGICIGEVPSISRRHARLRYSGRSVFIEDLGSTNGTYVNGQLIQGRTPLQSGDRFQVAAVHFKFLHEQDVEHAYYEAISDLVTRDGLTEVFNKRKYDDEADREFARALRYRRSLSLIVMDVDDFKEVNDSYGHLCGDFVLKQLTTMIRGLLRPEQVLARVGGDEFAILSPETDLDGARTLAEKLRDRVAGLDYSYCDCRIGVTCSFGVATMTPGMARPQDLYEAADQALYGAKRGGRNRVEVAMPKDGAAPAAPPAAMRRERR
jgi:diguanylate cyclase (GGDEF)-like protein